MSALLQKALFACVRPVSQVPKSVAASQFSRSFRYSSLSGSVSTGGKFKSSLGVAKTWPFARRHLFTTTRPLLTSSVCVNTTVVPKHGYAMHSSSQNPSHTVTTEDVKKLEEELKAKTLEERSLWVLRTGHENTYLSWARNAIISCVGGYTMYGQDHIPWNKEAALGLFLLGVTTFAIGSVNFIITSITLRRIIRLSPLMILWNCIHTIISLTLFCTAISIYIGLVAFESNDKTEKQVSSIQEV